MDRKVRRKMPTKIFTRISCWNWMPSLWEEVELLSAAMAGVQYRNVSNKLRILFLIVKKKVNSLRSLEYCNWWETSLCLGSKKSRIYLQCRRRQRNWSGVRYYFMIIFFSLVRSRSLSMYVGRLSVVVVLDLCFRSKGLSVSRLASV